MVRRKQKGGAAAVDISGVAAFNPSTLKDLVLWIVPEPDRVTLQSIADYANSQPPLIRSALIKIFGADLQRQVITELKSNTPGAPNSLVPLEVDTTVTTRFPTLISPATLDISCYVHPISREIARVALVTKAPIELPPNASILTRGSGLRIDYNEILDHLLVSAAVVNPAPNGTQSLTGELIIQPTAILQELLVYARTLSKGERELIEGYFAYRGVTQHLLPEGHPYLPDMLADPSIREVAEPLRAAEDALRIISGNLDAAVGQARATAAGVEPLQREGAIRGSITNTRDGLRALAQALSRAALAARASGANGLDQILANGSSNAPLNRDVFTTAISNAIATRTATENYIRELTGQAAATAVDSVVSMNEQTIALARKEAETEELLGTTEAQVQRREHIAALRIRDTELIGLGKSLLRERVAETARELDLLREAFTYQAKRRTEVIAATTAACKPLLAAFSSGEWLSRFPFLAANRDATGKFTEPLLATLTDKFTAIQTALTSGDVPDAATRLDAIFANANTLHSSWSSQPLTAIFQNLYLRHLSQQFASAESIHVPLLARLAEIEADAKILSAELDQLETARTVTPAPPSMATPIPPPATRFITPLSQADATLLRATTMETDASGTPLLRASSTGELDLTLGFGEIPPNALPRAKESILAQFPPDRFPNPIVVSLSLGQALELTPDARLVRFITPEGLVPPVSLPKYAVAAGAAIVLQNLGPHPLWVRNPGTLDDAIDLLGPGETTVYLYGGPDALEGTPGYAYGRCHWMEKMLPYDTVADTPRSAICAYHDEHKLFLYMDPATAPTFRPLLDHDGNCIAAARAADGNVYDMTDFSLSNPYVVTTVAANLGPVTLHKLPETLPIRADATTGLAVFCSPTGIPMAGEFGLLHACTTPLQWVRGTWKCKGASGDLSLTACGDALPLGPAGFLYPQGVTQDRLFRSRFFSTSEQPIFTTSQGIPLGSPSLTYIQLPRESQRVQGLISYRDGAQLRQAFLVNVEVTAGPGAILAPIDIPAVIAAQRSLLKASLVLHRYKSSLTYTVSIVKGLEAKTIAIRALGETMTTSIRESIDHTKEMIQARVGAFQELDVSIDKIDRAIQGGNIPNDVQISLGIMDLSLRDKLNEITRLLESIVGPVREYMLLVDSSTRLKGFVERLRKELVEKFQHGFEFLHRLQTIQTERTGALSAPEVETVAQRLREAKVGAEARQGVLESKLPLTTEYVSDLREGLLELQKMCGEQFAALAEVSTLLLVTLPRLIARANEHSAAELDKELQHFVAERTGLLEQMRRYLALVGEPGPISTLRDAPEPGPFAHAVMPSVERDLVPLSGFIKSSEQWLAMCDAFRALRMPGQEVYAQVRAIQFPIPSTGETEEAKVAMVETARSMASSANTQVKGWVAQFKEPMNTYTALVEEAMAGWSALSGKVIEAKQQITELQSQHVALDTLYRGLEGMLTEDEKARFAQIRSTLDGLQLESLATPQAPVSNPLAIPQAARAAQTSLQAIQHAQTTMDQSLATYSTLRGEIQQRMTALIQAQGITPSRPVSTLADAVDILAELRAQP